MRITKNILITVEQAQWIERNEINLSEFVQNAIDQEIAKRKEKKGL